MSRRAIFILGTIAVLLVASLALLLQTRPESYLKSLPSERGPYPRDARMVRRTMAAVQKTSDEQAIGMGINYLWRVRTMDPEIEKFLDRFCTTHHSWLVQEMYRILKSEDDVAPLGSPTGNLESR
jgi:hypothetical protein